MGEKVDFAGHRTQARVALESCSTPQALDHDPRSQETCRRARGLSEPGASPLGQVVEPAGHWAEARSPGRVGQPGGTSDLSASPLGHLFDIMGPRTLA